MPMEPIVKGNPTVLTSSSSSPLILTSGASGRINALLSMRALKSLIMLVNAFILLLLLPFRGRKRAQSMALSAAEKPRDEKQERKCATVRLPATIVSWKSSGNNTNSSLAVDQEVAVRRALAIRRVVEDKDKCEDSVREFILFQTPRGNTIFTQSWTPVSLKIRGLVVLLHGLNEHSGRYSDFAKQLNANGYKVFGMDWIGHGGSDGLHGYVHSLDDAVSDLKSYLQKVLADNPGLPCFFFGHSTGGAIVLKTVLDPSISSCISGVVLTSPAVGVQPSHPIYAVLAPIVSLLLPRLQVGAANKTTLPVTRDPDALVAKYSDPLVYTGAIRVRTGYEILKASSFLQQNLSKICAPFLVLHGTADEVTDPTASQKLYNEASSTEKSIRLLEGLLHDLLFEPERQSIMKEMIEWINSRL